MLAEGDHLVLPCPKYFLFLCISFCCCCCCWLESFGKRRVLRLVGFVVFFCKSKMYMFWFFTIAIKANEIIWLKLTHRRVSTIYVRDIGITGPFRQVSLVIALLKMYGS